MSRFTELSIDGGRCFYRPCGTMSAGESAHKIADALVAARRASAREVVVNVCEATGFETPGPAFRRWAVERWSAAVDNELRVAMVARHDEPRLLRTDMRRRVVGVMVTESRVRPTRRGSWRGGRGRAHHRSEGWGER